MTRRLAVSPRSSRATSRRGETRAGWLFLSPALILLGLFLIAPILVALWISLSDWGGRGSPFSSNVNFVGGQNYVDLFAGDGLRQRDLGIALRNNFWYVLLVVPIQTALALALAMLVTRKNVRANGFFRIAFYFPSITSAVAITVLWQFLFAGAGPFNAVLSWLSITGPNWFNDPTGILHAGLGALGVDQGPAALTENQFLSIPWWEWLAGPSVAMTALIFLVIFTTSGTFMLLFMAGLKNLPEDVDEAAIMDGANAWQRFWRVTLPQLRPVLFTVLALGIIGTWQVFDQIYAGTQGAPGKTTVTAAYLSYTAAFQNQDWPRGAAISFLLFGIIVIFTLAQRLVLSERNAVSRKNKPASARIRRLGRSQP
ncbi:MAG: carbohydrate ABC transporter permease [Actinomycetota bacterium]